MSKSTSAWVGVKPGVMNQLELLTMNDDHLQLPMAGVKIIVADCTLLEGTITI